MIGGCGIGTFPTKQKIILPSLDNPPLFSPRAKITIVSPLILQGMSSPSGSGQTDEKKRLSTFFSAKVSGTTSPYLPGAQLPLITAG